MRGKLLRCRIGQDRHRIIPAHAGQTFQMWGMQVHVSDHPRACGANALSSRFFKASHGSSPRMRGKRRFLAGHGIHVRIIPAHAGQTYTCRWHPPARTDHPRACGANNASSMVTLSICGSSPRMRGKHMDDGRHHRRRRIIPAHAGQTRPPTHGPVIRADHPRACGANQPLTVAVINTTGSSPRMRGKRDRHDREGRCGRIIPAHAGQTSVS